MTARMDATREALCCPVHKMPDCSPLLNGCSRVTAALAEVEEWEHGREFDREVSDAFCFERDQAIARAEAAEAERDNWRRMVDDLQRDDERLQAERDKLKEALERIAEMEPVKPLEHQEFLGGAYLPHGPVVGGARAALTDPGDTA